MSNAVVTNFFQRNFDFGIFSHGMFPRITQLYSISELLTEWDILKNHTLLDSFKQLCSVFRTLGRILWLLQTCCMPFVIYVGCLFDQNVGLFRKEIVWHFTGCVDQLVYEYCASKSGASSSSVLLDEPLWLSDSYNSSEISEEYLPLFTIISETVNFGLIR